MTTMHLQLESLGNKPRRVGEQPSPDGGKSLVSVPKKEWKL